MRRRKERDKKIPRNIFVSDCGNFVAIRIPHEADSVSFDVWRHDGSELFEGTKYVAVDIEGRGYNPRTMFTDDFAHPQKIVGSWTNLGHENREGEWIEAFEVILQDLETKESLTVQFHTALASLAPRYEKRRKENGKGA